MKKIARLLIAVLLLTSCGPQNCGKKSDFFEPINPEIRATSNGIKVFSAEDHELPTAELIVYLPYGSIDEPEGLEGLLSVTMQTMRLSGTPEQNPQKVEEMIDHLAISLEFSPGQEYATVTLSLQKKDLEKGFELLKGLLMGPVDPKSFQLVKSRSIESLRREKEDPWVFASRQYPEIIYGKETPWGRRATPQSVNQITESDVVSLKQHLFNPQKMVIAASGDFKTEELMKLLEQLTILPKATQEVIQESGPLKPVAVSYEKKMIVIPQKGLTQSTIVVGHLGDNRNNPDKYALLVMNFILGGSGALTSRMGEEIRSSAGKAYSVWSDFGFGKDLGIFKAIAQTATPNTVWVTEKMQDMIRDLHEHPKFTPEEIDRAKKAILRSLIFGFETRFEQVKEQARFYLYGYPDDYLINFQKGIDKVTNEDLERVAKKYLHPEGFKVLVITNEEESKKFPDAEIRQIP